MFLLVLAASALGTLAHGGSSVGSGQAKVVCWDRNQATAVNGSYETKPRSCRLWHRGHGADAEWAIGLRSLHWEDWGGREAAATAKAALVTTTPPTNHPGPIQIELREPVRRRGERVYSKAKLLGPDLEFRMRLYSSPDPGASRKPRTPVATVRQLTRAATARDGEKACALVTREGRSVIDASTLAGRKACIESVEDFRDEEIDVRLIRAKTLEKSHSKASVAAVLREDGKEESWILYLVKRPPRGWLVDGAEPTE